MPPPPYILSRFDVSLKLWMAALFSCVAVDNTCMCYRHQLKCVPLEDLFRTKPGVKSTKVSETKERAR